MIIRKLSTVALTAIFAAISLTAAAEEPYILNTPGAEAEYVIKNAKGKVQSYTKTTITDVKVTDAQNYSITQTAEVFDKEHASKAEPMSITMAIKEGRLEASPMEMLAGMMSAEDSEEMEREITIEGEFPSVPTQLHIGQTSDHAFSIAVKGMKISSEGTRKVTARETVTVPAGTFDCFRVESEMSMKMIMSFRTKSVSWYAAGVGEVKSESYDRRGNLETVKELISLTK